MSSYKLLVTDEVDPDGVDLLRAEESFIVDEIPTPKPNELLQRIGEYDAFVGRSATRLPAEVLRRATKLRVIGRAGVGTDNIDIPTATSLGIAIINAPGGNTVAVAELFFGTVIGLLRHLPRAFSSMREGRWDRAELLGTELRDRSLGIVGLGRIGGEIATRARAFGMNITAYDPYVTDERFDVLRVTRSNTLKELLESCDIVTVHTPLTPETTGLIGASELALLRPGSIVANLARGGIVEEQALMSALSSGHLQGAILDVYTKEPLDPAHPFRSLPNVVLTPHLGASTAEGQHNVAVDVCNAVRDTLLNGELSRAINVVGGIDGRWDEIRPGLVLARRMAAIGRAMLADRGLRAIDSISLTVGRDLAAAGNLLVASAAAGALESIIDGVRLNLVNARTLAESRGITLSVRTSPSPDPDNSLRVAVCSGRNEIVVAGSAPPGSGPRLTMIDGFTIDVTPRRTLLVLTNADVPGVIGHVGTLLGNAGVNIAEYHQARLSQGGEALAAVSVDGGITPTVRGELLALPDIRSATVIDFSSLDPAGEEAWS